MSKRKSRKRREAETRHQEAVKTYARQITEAEEMIATLHRSRRARRTRGTKYDRPFQEGVYKWNQRLRALKAKVAS